MVTCRRQNRVYQGSQSSILIWRVFTSKSVLFCRQSWECCQLLALVSETSLCNRAVSVTTEQWLKFFVVTKPLIGTLQSPEWRVHRTVAEWNSAEEAKIDIWTDSEKSIKFPNIKGKYLFNLFIRIRQVHSPRHFTRSIRRTRVHPGQVHNLPIIFHLRNKREFEDLGKDVETKDSPFSGYSTTMQPMIASHQYHGTTYICVIYFHRLIFSIPKNSPIQTKTTFDCHRRLDSLDRYRRVGDKRRHCSYIAREHNY